MAASIGQEVLTCEEVFPGEEDPEKDKTQIVKNMEIMTSGKGTKRILMTLICTEVEELMEQCMIGVNPETSI